MRRAVLLSTALGLADAAADVCRGKRLDSLLTEPAVKQKLVEALGFNSTVDLATSGLKWDSSGFSDDVCTLAEGKVKDVDDWERSCSAYCGSQNIPLLLGSRSFGFDLYEMNSVCLGSGLNADKALLDNCRSWSDKISAMYKLVSDFVAASQEFTVSQMAYKADMAKKVETVKQKVFSQEIHQRMMEANAAQAVTVLKEIYDSVLAESVEGSDGAFLKIKATALKEKSKKLQQQLEESVTALDSFMSKCNDMFLGTTNTDAGRGYLLDICAQRGKETCIETLPTDSSEASHIGCCCAHNPVSAMGGVGVVGAIPGKGVAETRRLSPSGPVDICGLAHMTSKPEIAKMKTAVRQMGQSSLIKEQESKLKESYPSYYDWCTAGRRLDDNSSGTPQAGDTPAQSPQSGVNHVQCSPKKLGDLKTSKATTFGDVTAVQEDLVTAFTDITRKDVCNLLPGFKSNDVAKDKLMDYCSKFCGKNNIPLILGSISYGFTLKQMNQICLGNQIKYDPAKMKSCAQKGESVTSIERQAALLLSAVKELEAGQVRYRAAIAGFIKETKIQLMGEELKRQMARQSSRNGGKIGLLKQVYQKVLSDQTFITVQKNYMQDDVNRVKTRVNELNTNFQQHLTDLTEFLDDCNEVQLGQGTQKEYLLDICAQKSTDCAEDGGEHIGCCCGHNPVSAMGLGKYESNIPGVKGSPGFSVSRRLSTLATADAAGAGKEYPMDICAQAFISSSERVSEHERAVRELGYGEIWDKYYSELRERYPDYYKSCTRHASGSPFAFGAAAVVAAVLFAV